MTSIKSVGVIGTGLSGLEAATLLGRKGTQVKVYKPGQTTCLGYGIGPPIMSGIFAAEAIGSTVKNRRIPWMPSAP